MKEFERYKLDEIVDKDSFIEREKIIKNNSEIKKSLPSRNDVVAGIYVFYSNNHKPLYVGKTNNIRNRILQHLNHGHFPINLVSEFVDYIGIVPVCDKGINTETDLVRKEDEVITWVKPLFNGTPSYKGVYNKYGYHNFRERLNKIGGKDCIERDDNRRKFIEKVIRGDEVLEEYRISKKKGVYGMGEVEVVREVVKLIIEEGKERDKNDLIDGVLTLLKR